MDISIERGTLKKEGDNIIEVGYQIKNKDEFAMYLRQIFGGIAGNSINYVADIIDSSADDQGSLLDVKENIFTAVIEHPFAESVSEYNYELEWEENKKGLRLKSKFGYLDEIYSESVENLSGQIPDFEKERNIRNKKLYTRLKNLRENGIYKPVVEFSPSPELTEEAVKRGYKGYDAIFLYRYEKGKEKVKQYWLDKQDLDIYQQLIKVMSGFENSALPGIQGLYDKEKCNDVDIMDCSGELTNEQYLYLLNFIEKNTPNIDSYKNRVVEYAHSKIHSQIDSDVFPKVENLARDLVNSKVGTADVEKRLKEIMGIMSRMQVELYLAASSRQIDTDITLDEYLEMSEKEKFNCLARIAYEFTGCGISDTVNMSVEIFGKSGGMLMETSKLSSTEWSKVKCKNPSCVGTWYVINGRPDTYKSICPICGISMKC